MSNEITLSGITKKTCWVMAVLLGLAIISLKVKLVLGVAIGGLLAVLNFKILRLTTIRGLTKGQRAKGYILLSFLARIPVLAVLFCLILFLFNWLCLAGAAVGFLSVIIAISLEGMKIMEVKDGS